MIEEQRLYEDLQGVDLGIEAPDMRQFVRQDDLELLGCQAGNRTDRQEDDRAKNSHNAWRFGEGRHEDADSALESHALREVVNRATDNVRRRRTSAFERREPM